MTPEQVIADALAQADRLFEDQIRAAMTRVLTVEGAAEAPVKVPSCPSVVGQPTVQPELPC